MKIQKIITDNIPLLDEIVYYTKLLGLDTILKDEDLALANETNESLKSSDIYIACMDGKASIYMFNYSKEDLILSGIVETDPNMNRYLSNSDYIPVEVQPKLLKILVDRYISEYEEKNNYYRSLYGLPDYVERFIPNVFYDDVVVVDDQGLINFEKPLHLFSINEIKVLEKSGYLNQILKLTNSKLIEWEVRKGINVTKKCVIGYNDWDYIPEEFYEEVESYSIPTNLPMHMYNASESSTLDYIGVMDYYKDNYPKKTYIKFISDKKITPYNARKLDEFGIIYVPNVAVDEIRNKYYEKLLLNRDFVIRTTYSSAYKIHSTHYNDFIKIYIIVLTMADMISSASDFIIKRELFDIRTIEYLLTSYGVTFFTDIPLRYQQKIVKRLNSLLKYKSSPTCMELISALFDVDDIKIYKYFLVKTRAIDKDGVFTFSDPNNIHLYHTDAAGNNLTGVYELDDESKTGYDRVWKLLDNDGSLKAMIIHIGEGENSMWALTEPKGSSVATTTAEEPIGDWVIDSINFSEAVYTRYTDTEIDDYDLKFCKVLLNDHLEDYINDEDNFKDYNLIVEADPYWNGDRSGDLVRKTIMEEKFNFVRTKYFSIDVMYDLSEISVQRPYLYGMLFDEEERPASVNISVNAISPNKTFKLNDLICYLLSLSYKSFGIIDKIPNSKEDIMELIGFDFTAAIEELQQYLYENEVDDIDLDNFTPGNSYASFAELMTYYKNNRDLRKQLIEKMNNADNKRIYDIYRTIYDATMIQMQTDNLFIKMPNDGYKESKDIIVYYGEEYKDISKDAKKTYTGTYKKSGEKEWKGDKATISYSETKAIWELKDLNDKVIATLPNFEQPIGYWDASNVTDGIYTRYPDEVKDGYYRYTTYQEFINARDPILGESLRNIDNITDDTTKYDTISSIIISSIEALEALFYDPKEPDILRFAFSNLGSVSLESITAFIKHLIDFFKSFTVQLAEINSIFKIGTPFENKLSPIDDIHKLIISFLKPDIIEIQDGVNQILTTNTLGDDIGLIERVYIEPYYENI